MERKYFAVDGAFGSNYELNPNVNLTIPQSPSSPLCLPMVNGRRLRLF